MPSRLGRYAVRRRIGAGGFATVWLAYDEQLDSPVAIKVLADNWTEDHQVRQRFLEEGRYLRRVESPHVVTVYDAGELEDGRPYLVMTYADQGTLADRLEVDGLAPRQALEVIRQVGLGLTALHRRDILHRDIKPANVLFRTVAAPGAAPAEIRAMVGDLGLGKALDVSSRLTMVAGTPSYVAPEQAAAQPPDARADQYSLAVLAYLLLAGRPPYSHADLAAASRPEAPPPLSTLERPFDDEVDAVIRRGLSPDRDDRWPDVASFVEALTAALGDLAAHGPEADARPWLALDPDLTLPGAKPTPLTAAGPLPEPDLPRTSRRRRVLATGASALALVVLSAGAFAGGYALQRPDRSEVTLHDDEAMLSTTVPHAWSGSVATAGWHPHNADGASFAALSAGTSTDWAEREDGQGVFVGLLPATELPPHVPRHPECASAGDQTETGSGDQRTLTVTYDGCPGGVTIERVSQVATTLLLWVQVRAADRLTANQVLRSVVTYGV